MAANSIMNLPEGFVLDESSNNSNLPQGFVLDEPTQPERQTIKGGVSSIRQNPVYDTVMGFVDGFNTIPHFITDKIDDTLGFSGFINENIRPLIGKKPLTTEELEAMEYKPQTAGGHIGEFVGSTLPYFAMPTTRLAGIGKLGNMAATGAYQGGLAGLTESGGDFGAAGLGAGIGAALPPALKGVGVVGSKLLAKPATEVYKFAGNMMSSIPQEVLERALKKELAGQSILSGNFNAKDAFGDISNIMKQNIQRLPGKSYFDDVNKQLGQQAEQAYYKNLTPDDYFKNQYNELGNKVQDSLNHLQDITGQATKEGRDSLKKINKVIPAKDIIAYINKLEKAKKFGRVNALEGNDKTSINILKKELKNLNNLTPEEAHGIKNKIQNLLEFSSQTVKPNTTSGKGILSKTSSSIDSILSELSPTYKQNNLAYSSIMNIKDRLGGKLKDENVGNLMSSFAKKDPATQKFMEELNNLAPEDLKFMPQLQELLRKETLQNEFTKTLPKSIFKDFGRVKNTNLKELEAIEKLDKMTDGKLLRRSKALDVIKENVPQRFPQRIINNPRLLRTSNIADSAQYEPFEFLEKYSKNKFMDKIDDALAREKFEPLLPGLGGGSGGEQGFANITRALAVSKLPMLIGLLSPRTQKAIIQGIGKVNRSPYRRIEPRGFSAIPSIIMGED